MSYVISKNMFSIILKKLKKNIIYNNNTMDIGMNLSNNLEKNNLQLIKKENFCDKIYEKAYQTFVSKILSNNLKIDLINISPIKLTRSVNIIN